MIKGFKRLVKSSLGVFGVDIRRISEYEKDVNRNRFVWLRGLNINTILDIGANVGQFALEINKYLPSAKVYSFEPLKDEYLQLVRNAREVKNFGAFNIALGNFDGTARIYRNEFSPSSSLLEMADLHKEAYPFTANTSEEEIAVRKLDNVIGENMDLEPEILIKLDVQGYEDRVIEGGINTFIKTKILIAEVGFQELYKGQALFDLIYVRLKELGFKYRGNLSTYAHSKTGLPIFADAVFIRE